MDNTASPDLVAQDKVSDRYAASSARSDTSGSITPSSMNLSPPMPANGFLVRPKVKEMRSTSASGNKTHASRVLQQSQGNFALSDTPNPTAPSSPNMYPRRQMSGDDYGRKPPTTLDIPGITKSRVSPDGKIAQRDVGSKLVIVMVGLPARGKSYITKKMARYLNWLQHDTKIFNVGERRRVAASGHGKASRSDAQALRGSIDAFRKSLNENGLGSRDPKEIEQALASTPEVAAQVLVNGDRTGPAKTNGRISDPSHQQHRPPTVGPDPNQSKLPELYLPSPGAELNMPPLDAAGSNLQTVTQTANEGMDQTAAFFDPSNRRAALIREQCALDSLNDLLDYILLESGSVGILDATNSTLERRKLIMRHIRERAGPDLNVLFIESLCVDEQLLENNMRLKLSGPDYRDKDPEASLADFRKRVAIYEKAYVPLGKYEEDNDMPYVQMVDVGRKVISHQVRGFLSAQAVYYLLNFNLSPRQIWITRHGQSVDNVLGRIGGDSDLSPHGQKFARVLAKFINFERQAWGMRQREKESHTHLPPLPGDATPPNPHWQSAHSTNFDQDNKNFCVWTSMLKRSVQTSADFDDVDFEVKQIRLLDELFAGHLEGLTYPEIFAKYPDEYARRREDKLHYRYPGPGGEGYLDVINRLRPVIVELERMTDHVLLIGHRSVARVLLAYFLGLGRERVAQLDVPLGMLYCLEPKPYGVDFKAYRYDEELERFNIVPNYEFGKVGSEGEQYFK